MVGSLDADSPNGLPLASFWECREYQRTVKRVESSYKLCNELSLMIQERAELEKAYSVNLKRWSARWLSFLDSGLEYGTGALAWKGLCREAETISNAHQSVRNLLIDEIQTGLKHWQKEHFHKTPLPPQTLKESKLFEQDFEQAQKPWAKRLKKMTQCKKDFHQACKMERSLQVQVQNAKTDPSGTPEQQADEDRKLKKIQEKLKKAEKEVERAQFVYNNALDDLRSESPRYLEEMTKSVRNLLIDEIQTGLKHWQKEHFHKTPLPPQTLKESKLFEQDFEQAQKPWAKRLKKMTQCKKDFHQACKMERSLQVQVQNAKTDPSGTPEQQADEDRKLKKIQEKLKKAEKEVERAQFVYNNALDDLRSESPRYLEEMTKVSFECALSLSYPGRLDLWLCVSGLSVVYSSDPHGYKP
ncbi:hypothetical protein AHF37_09193 [Paragonimus kellicotti]|nr:hypothetical protein AHF37_09193 [Paragonimus kellicotti]